jgi:hypothetical protein
MAPGVSTAVEEHEANGAATVNFALGKRRGCFFERRSVLRQLR